MITPAIRATLPAFQYVSERDRTPEPEPQSEPEPNTLEVAEFTLQPRTYTPVPQKPPTPEPEEPPPELKPRSSLRQRFSLKKKEIPEKKAVPERRPTLTAFPTTAPVRQSVREAERESSQTVPVWQSARQSTREIDREPTPPSRPQTSSSYRPPQFIDATSPAPSRGSRGPDSRGSRVPEYRGSRGPDSAYCSDNDKVLHHASSQEYFSSRPRDLSGNNYVNSPMSDQQHFRPVRASPNSPLQRPWTAGPTNLRSYSASTTNLSMMTDVTTFTENGTKMEKKKKRRGPLGWLKNAFALSEEEKAEFESRRRAPTSNTYVPERRPQKMFLDGKRIR
jgi:hypothetical protein